MVVASPSSGPRSAAGIHAGYEEGLPVAGPVAPPDVTQGVSEAHDVAKSMWWHHLIGLVWCTLLAFLLLGPALLHGSMIGPYYLLAKGGLTSRAGVPVVGNYFNTRKSDQPDDSVDLSGVDPGAPMVFCHYGIPSMDWACRWPSIGSRPCSVFRRLLGTSCPSRDAYGAGVVVTLVIAGSGAYVLGRTLRLGIIGALTIATVFELCGPLVAWLGYHQAQTMAWGGWLFAAGLLVVRGKHRIPAIAFFAVVTACTIYAGHPETLIVMLLATLLFVSGRARHAWT